MKQEADYSDGVMQNEINDL